MSVELSAYQKLSLKAVKNHIPLQCVFELTYRCNLKCCHCYLAQQPVNPELTARQIYKILDQLVDAGCLWLVLTGGEIFTRRDFFKIAAYARQKSFNLILLTNGTLITEPIAEQIKDLRACVDISLYGFRKTHDRITGVSGSFDRTMRGIKLLLKKGVRVSTKAVVMDKNIDQVWQLRDFLKPLGVDVTISPDALLISPRDDGSFEPLNHRVQSRRQLQDYFKEFARRLKKTGQKFKLINEKQDYKLCGTGLSACSISAQGELNPCVQIKLHSGNSLLRKSFAEIWHGHPEINLLRKLTVADKQECRGCRLVGYCFRCPGIAKLEEGSYTVKIPEACRLAEIQKEVFEKYSVFKYAAV